MFFRNSEIKDGYENEYRDINEKLCGWSTSLNQSILQPFGFSSPLRQRGSE